MTAKLSKNKGGATAEVFRHVKTIAHREVRPAASFGFADFKHLSGFNNDGRPELDEFTIEFCRRRGAGERNDGVLMKAEFWPDKCNFQSGGIAVISDNAVRQTKCVIIHRPGRRNAHAPVADAAWVILNAGISARLNDFNRWRLVNEAGKFCGRHIACDKKF